MKQKTSEVPRLLSTLKSLYKSRSILYADIAKSMGVSETTIKRYMSGHGLTVEILEQLCDFVGLGFSDLVEMSKDDSGKPDKLTIEQEEALASSPFVGMFFYLLCHGYTPATLQRDLKLTDAELNGYLTALDRIGVIQLFPFNRVRLTVNKDFIPITDGPLVRSAKSTTLPTVFETFDSSTPNWSIAHGKLSPSSVARVRELIHEFTIAFKAIADQDRDLTMDLAGWQTVFLVLSPFSFEAVGGPTGTSKR